MSRLMNKNLLHRLVMAAIFIPFLLFIYIIGGYSLLCLLAIISAFCTYEIIRMYEKENFLLLFTNILLSLVLFFILAMKSPLGNIEKYNDFILIGIFFVILTNGASKVIHNRLNGAFISISGALFAVVYPAISFALMYRLYYFHVSLVPILASFVWICDSAAYFVGVKFGKHKNIFQCSPNKSLEGFVGGIIIIAISCFILSLFNIGFYNNKVLIYLLISVGIFGQFGDLLESILKRDMNLKDSSLILPGHGGILDRFDSLLLASPMMYIFMIL